MHTQLGAVVVAGLAGLGCAPPGPDEPTAQLRRLFEGAVSYYNDEHVTDPGLVLPKQFPVTTPLTPAGSGCIGPVPVPFHTTKADWAHPSWAALGFEPPAVSYYQYQFVSGGIGAGSWFTMRAVADLDCDGIVTIHERYVEVGIDLEQPRLPCSIYTKDELE